MHIPLQDIPALFSLLHDGEISAYSKADSALSIVVTIPYLAERIDPAFTTFTIVLYGVRRLEFHTWPRNPTVPPAVLTEMGQIVGAELEILGAHMGDGGVAVACMQHDPDYDYGGGTLVVMPDSAAVFDEAGAAYSVDSLKALARSYWRDEGGHAEETAHPA